MRSKDRDAEVPGKRRRHLGDAVHPRLALGLPAGLHRAHDDHRDTRIVRLDRHSARSYDNLPAMPPKTACPVSLTHFMEKAEPLKVSINGQEMLAEVKQFSTGSFGWYMNGKTLVQIDGKPI